MKDKSDIDRELQDALAIEPSTEFVAGLRMRIAADPAPSAWRVPRVLVAVGALAAMLVAAVLVLRPHEQTTPRSADVSLSIARPLPTDSPAFAPPIAASAPGGPAAAAAPRSDVHRQPSSSGTPGFGRIEPEVLVSQAEMQSLRRLIALANQGDTGLESLLAEPAPPAPIPEIQPIEIVIAPIKIEPLAPDTY